MTDTTQPITAFKGQRMGATYSKESHNFGEIQWVFPVPADWQGFRFHGYCWAPEGMKAGAPLPSEVIPEGDDPSLEDLER